MERLLDARGLRAGIAWPSASASARSLRVRLGKLVRRRALRHRLLAAVAVAVLLGLGWIGLRRSPLVAVTHVRVSGVHGLYGAQITRALTATARRQTTLALDVAALRAAVAPYGVVSGLRVSAAVPHTLRIRVIEQLPVATLMSPDGHAAAAAADGAVLGPAVAIAGMPTIPVPMLPVGRAADPRLAAELQALGPAPAVLLRRVVRVFFGPQGLTVTMRNGLRIYFGDASLAHAKWIAAALVIADRSGTGATYVDVRLPDRPAAGGLTAGSSTTAGGSVASGTSAGASSQAGLVATLAAALGGGATATTGAPAAATGAGAPTSPTTGAGSPAASTAGTPITTSSSTGG